MDFCFLCWNYNFSPSHNHGVVNFHTDRTRTVTLTWAEFWTWSPTEPRCRLKRPKSDTRRWVRRHTPWPDSCPDARARPRSPRCPSPIQPWWRRWNRMPSTGHRGWSSSSGPHSRGPRAVRTRARRSLGWSRLGQFYLQSTWREAKRRMRSSSRHHDGLVQCISETPFWFCMAKVEQKTCCSVTQMTGDMIYSLIFNIIL